MDMRLRAAYNGLIMMTRRIGRYSRAGMHSRARIRGEETHAQDIPDGYLRAEEVYVWAAALDLADAEMGALEGVLSSDEKARAEKFALPGPRLRYVAARGILRMILSRYAGRAPAEIAFSYGPHGKPLLSETDNPNDIHFNVSHSGTCALVAVTKGRGVGVDIESIGEHRFDEAIARRFFAPGERDALRAASEAGRAETFTTIWVRKEACVKASGLGIALPLDSFDVSLNAREPRLVVSGGGVERGGRSWTLVDVETVPGYAAACAVEGTGLNLIHGEFRL